MKIAVRPWIVAAVAATFACAVSPVFAQTPAGGVASPGATPGAGAATPGKHLDLSLVSVETYDSNLPAAEGSISATQNQESGFHTGLIPTLDLRSVGPRLSLRATGGSSLRYYGNLQEVVVMDHHVGAGLLAHLARRTTLSLNQTASSAPASLAGLFASPAAAAQQISTQTTDYTTTLARSHTFTTTAGLAHQATGRSTVSIDGALRHVKSVGGTVEAGDFTAYDLASRFTHQFKRNSSVRLGYSFREARYSSSQTPIEHNLNLGMDHRWPHSATRATTFGFSVGAASVSGLAQTATSTATDRHYQVTGDASLVHQVSRTWKINGDFRRSIGFLEGLEAPVASNAFTVGADGRLTSRVDLLFSGAYSNGESAFATAMSAFSTVAGNARVTFRLGRNMTTFVEYLYYAYDFDAGLQLVPGLPGRLHRHSVRVGVNLLAPMRLL